jgi:hypothetical protein
MIKSFNHDIKQTSQEENVILMAPLLRVMAAFNEKEIHEAISQMELNNAPEQMGFLWNFTRKCGT